MSKLSLGVEKVATALARLPELPEPAVSTVVALHDRCRLLEAWMDRTENLTALMEAKDWLAAVERFLEAKGAQGPAQTTARLLEARIGDLLPRGEGGKGKLSVATDSLLSRQDAHDFRLMAERRDVWLDKLPLARRRVLRLIRDDDADLRPEPERPVALLSRLEIGDFRQVLADIPDESLDLILTDPPYPAEFLPLWGDLALFAKRTLAPHGMLAAMSGQTHLPEVYRRLGEHLPYRWTMAYLMTGSANVVHARRVSTMWKPVLIYGSTTRRLHDVATSKGADKDYHGWGQSESGMYDLLSLLADPGATVCDPFAGGGTTAVVAAAHGCHFVGAEIDPATHAIAAKRLAS